MAAAIDPVDWTAPEAAIEERLRQGLLATGMARALATAEDMSGIQEVAQATPALYLVYMGARVADADATRASYQHDWVVVTAVKQAAPTTETRARHRLAAPLVRKVSELLHGWRPVEGFGQLVPVTPPPVAYSALGFAYVPLRFRLTAQGVAQGAFQGRPR